MIRCHDNILFPCARQVNKSIVFRLCAYWFIFGVSQLSAQVNLSLNETHQVRALIVGISDYARIQDLQYADNDAEALHQFLVSNTSSNIEIEQLTLLVDSNATAANIYAELDRLVDESSRGDWVYIFFSGHGDVEQKTSAKRGFLLCHDVLPAAYQQGGSLPIIYIQDYIQTISKKGAKVIVVIDACRSGSLAGGITGNNLTNAALQGSWANEIKLLSSQPGELSQESAERQHGVFSYYLIQGLYGIADHNQNQEVSMIELLSFLINHVPKATSDDQNPIASGDMQSVVSHVNLDIFGTSRSNGQFRSSSNHQESVDVEVSELAKPSDKSYTKPSKWVTDKYTQFLQYIESGALVPPPERACALGVFQELSELPEAQTILPEMRRKLATALQEEIQRALGLYFEVKDGFLDDIDSEQLSLYCNVASTLLGEEHVLYSELSAKRLFFHSFEIHDAKEKEKVLLEALAIDPDMPFIEHELAQNFYRSGSNNLARKHYEEVRRIAPGWNFVYPFPSYAGGCTKGNCDTGKGMYSYPDGGYYKGEWRSGLLHGQGEYHMSNGDKYVGEWQKNTMHGQGTYSYSNGDQYEGQFVKDEMEGHGVYTFSDGGFYEGEWKNGLQHGAGTLTYDNGSQITGVWNQGKVNGKAKFLYVDGSIYEGDYVNSKRNGFGKMLNSRGDLYEGYWRSGRKNGKGRMAFATGMVYDGDWKDGRMSGVGRLTTPTGSDYNGEFSNGKYNGFGNLHFNNGDRYEGNWMNGKMHGQGTYEYGDGSIYEGEWVMDMRHGQGTYAFADGTVYTGQFISGKLHGKGKMVKPNGEVQEGKYEYGQYRGSN